MKILGLDLSLNCAGWFLFESDNMSIIDYGYIPNEGEEAEKILRIYKTLNTIIKQYKPDRAGIEKEFASKNMDTLMSLSHVHGAVLLLLAQYNIPYTYYSVMTAKSKTLDGMKLKKDDGTKKTGSEMKAEVAGKIFEIFGRQNFIKAFTDDVTDAASIGYTYLVMNGQPVEKKTKKKTVKKKKDVK